MPLLLAAIMVGGLLVRLPFWLASAQTLGWPLVLDEGNYVGIAEPLARGEGIVDKWAWMRPPGYPAYIALFLILGFDLTAAALAQILLSVANIGLVYALTLEVFHHHAQVSRSRAQAAGLLAAGLLALNPHAAYYADLLMPEPLYMLALTVMAWALLRAVRLWRPIGRLSRPALLMVVAAALASTAAIYMRSALQTFVPLALGWLFVLVVRKRDDGRWTMDDGLINQAGISDSQQSNRPSSIVHRPSSIVHRPSSMKLRGLIAPLLFLLVMFAAIAPWTLRNYLTYDRFMLMDAVGGLNLWQYNGGLSRAEVLARLSEISNPVDRDRYATEQGLKAILSEPGRFLGDAVARFTEAWPVEYYGELWVGLRNKYPGIECAFLDIFSWASTLYYVGFGLLVIWGFALAPGRAFKVFFLLFLLHYALTTMFAHNEFRYRLPLYPYASVFAGWGLLRLGEWVGGWRRKGVTLGTVSETPLQEPGARKFKMRLLGLIAAGLLSLTFVAQSALIAMPGLVKSLSFERRYQDGKARMERGDYAGALASFLGAAEVEKGCACLYRNIGLAHGALGQRDEEGAAYLTALEREEYDWRAAALLSDRLRMAGNPRASSPIRATRPEYRVVQQRWAWDNLRPTPISDLDLGDADIGYVRDWHAIETEGDITYRWSRERSAVRLAVPPGEGRVQMLLDLHSLAWPGKAGPDAQVRVLLDGNEMDTLTARPGWGEVTMDLNVLEGGRQIVIELETATARPPGEEIRHLGVAVDRIRLQRGP